MEQIVIKAVAGVLKRNNHVLMASRPLNKIHGGSWEFPGGKLETNETPVVALIRELNEEVGVMVNTDDCEYLTHIVQDYDHGQVQLDVVIVHKWQNEVEACEGQSIHWQNLTQKCLQDPLLITTQKILDLLITKYT